MAMLKLITKVYMVVALCWDWMDVVVKWFGRKNRVVLVLLLSVLGQQHLKIVLVLVYEALYYVCM